MREQQAMEVTRRDQVIKKDGEILLTGLPYKRGDRVEVVIKARKAVARTVPRPCLTVRQLRQSGLIGLWKDRNDIEDSSTYARYLRERAEQRGEMR
ncbi:MAG: hypothetical protein QXP01_09035 [Candidatus Hadarchaeum sp.]